MGFLEWILSILTSLPAIIILVPILGMAFLYSFIVSIIGICIGIINIYRKIDSIIEKTEYRAKKGFTLLETTVSTTIVISILYLCYLADVRM